jgi:hypothetical protein
MCNNNPYYSKILEAVLDLFFFNIQFTLTNIWFFLRDLNYFHNNILCVARPIILLVFGLIKDQLFLWYSSFILTFHELL